MVAAAVSVLLLVLFFWWFRGDFVLTLGYAVIALLATLTVPLVYRFAGFTQADELEWLENREAQEHLELLDRLRTTRAQLDALGIDEGVRQADMLSGILDDYHSVVETRFLGKKHSPLAYLEAARSVQKHAVQNLTDVVAVGHSLSTIRKNDALGDSTRRANQAELDDGQSGRMESILEENRKLFDALTDTAVEVANIKSFSRYEKIDTLSRLVSLAEIANNSGHSA